MVKWVLSEQLVIVLCRPTVEPAVEEEAKPEVKAEDAPDVAAQRAREKSSEEEGQYWTNRFLWFGIVCCHIYYWSGVNSFGTAIQFPLRQTVIGSSWRYLRLFSSAVRLWRIWLTS